MAINYGDGPRHSIRISGVAATVRAGARLAADLGAWTVDGGWLVGEIKSVDPFRITQPPHALEIRNASGPPTVRPLADVSITGSMLTARVLPKGTPTT